MDSAQFRKQAPRTQLSDDPDTATEQTVQEMCRQIHEAAKDPLVQRCAINAWFQAVFEAPTAPQRMGWPVIARGESALILAPTAGGKTESALLPILSRMLSAWRKAAGGGASTF